MNEQTIHSHLGIPKQAGKVCVYPGRMMRQGHRLKPFTVKGFRRCRKSNKILARRLAIHKYKPKKR